MRLKVDGRSANRFVELARAEYDDRRRYYVTRLDDPVRAIVVCRNGTDLFGLVGYVVDANVGYEDVPAGFTWESDVGQRHSKITIYRRLRVGRAQTTLSRLLDGAPRRNQG